MLIISICWLFDMLTSLIRWLVCYATCLLCWLFWYANYFDTLTILICCLFVMSFICYSRFLICWFIVMMIYCYVNYLIWHLFDMALIWYGIYLIWHLFVMIYIWYVSYLLRLLMYFLVCAFLVMLRNTLICTSKFIRYPASWRVFWYASSIYGMIVSHAVSILYSSLQFVLYEHNLHVH